MPLLIIGWLCCALSATSFALEQRLSESHLLVGKNYEVESNTDPADTKVMLAHLEAFHEHLSSVFAGIAAPHTTPDTVRYCRDRASFLSYGRATCPGFSDGWYGYQRDGDGNQPGEIVLMLLGHNYSVLQHEAFHRFMFRAYPKLRAWPRWFDEGLADWIARGQFVKGRFTIPNRLDPQDVNRVRDALNNQTFIPLEQLFTLDASAWNGKQQTLIYAEGYLFAAWIMSTDDKPYGGLMRRFLVQLKETNNYETTFAATFAAVGINQLQNAWLAWLKKI
jgi:hypothetical protein